MGKLNQEQEKVLSQIDSILTMIERSGGIEKFDNITISISPLKLLLSILKHCGVGYDEIVDWLASYIVKVTPIIEIAVKGLLLAQLKANIDCNSDPRIPKKFREDIGGITMSPAGDDTDDSACEVDLSSIDFYGLLNNSPMSDGGRYNYFGTNTYYTIGEKKIYNYKEAVKYCIESGVDESSIQKTAEIDSIYELVRARDMNAFLWFVLHKAKFLNAQNIGEDSNHCILKTINDESDNYHLGGCYSQSCGGNYYSVMGLCIKRTPNQSATSGEDTIKENATSNSGLSQLTANGVASTIQNSKSQINGYTSLIVPTTNLWCGCNWYVNRKQYLKNIGGKEFQREYDKEFALFRLNMKMIDGRTTNKLTFKIKPAPNVLTPTVDIQNTILNIEKGKTLTQIYEGEMPWSFHYLVFDADGKKDLFGKYSVVVGNRIDDNGKETVYSLKNPSNNNNNTQLNGVKLYVNKKGGGYRLEGGTPNIIRSALYECYPGFTIYEFNYDFIMGMQFFDATVITAQLIEALSNISMGFGVKKITTDYKMRLSQIVKKMLDDTYGYKSTDCFYSFSNAEYEAMQEQSELKRANLYPFHTDRYNATQVRNGVDVYGILNEMNSASDSTLEKNISIVSSALTQVTATVSQEVLPEDKYSFEFDFISQAIEMITTIFVEALLSPKILLILLINQKMIGEEGPSEWRLEDIINAFLNVIMSMISQLIEMLIQRLLEFVMELLRDLLAAGARILMLEQIEYYMRLMDAMLKACRFTLPKNPDLVSTLDNVNYADIDINDQPITNEC